MGYKLIRENHYVYCASIMDHIPHRQKHSVLNGLTFYLKPFAYLCFLLIFNRSGNNRSLLFITSEKCININL